MPVLEKHEAVALVGIVKMMRGSNLQVRAPSYTQPSYWSRPLFQTRMRPILANTDWQDFLVVRGRPQYVAIVKQYVATSVGPLDVSGLEFRFLMDGNPLTSVTLTAGVERNKDGPFAYPVVPRDIFLPVNETQTLSLQVKNPTVFQRSAVGQLSGWLIDSMDSTVTADSNAQVDGISHAMLGAPYGDQ
jgi:hypothetical protein